MIAFRCYVMDVCVVVSFCTCNPTLTEKDVEIDKSESQCVVCHTNVKMLERFGLGDPLSLPPHLYLEELLAGIYNIGRLLSQGLHYFSPKEVWPIQVTHEEVFKQKTLLGEGQIVRSSGMGLFRVMEIRKIGQNIEVEPQPRMIPIIYLDYGRVRTGVLPGIGKMFAYAYTLHENTIAPNWEIVEGD